MNSQTTLSDQFSSYWDQLPRLILAIIIILIGWLAAKFIAAAIKKAMDKAQVDTRIHGLSGRERHPDQDRKYSVSTMFSKIIYFLILLFAVVWAFSILHLAILAQPLLQVLNTIASAVPSLLKAALILLAAWLIAILVKKAIERFGPTLIKPITKWRSGPSEPEARQTVSSAARMAFYLILLLALPGVLSALHIAGVSEPFRQMLGSFLMFIPRLFAAVLIFLIGYMIAKIVRSILTNFLESAGAERLAKRLGFHRLFPNTSLSKTTGTIAFILLLIPTTISALQALKIEGLSVPAVNMLNTILTMLPNIAIAVLFIFIGLLLGKYLQRLVTRLLNTAGFNTFLNKMGLGALHQQNIPSLSQLAGYLVNIVVVLLFAAEAFQVLKLSFLVNLATGVAAYLPRLFTALLIVGIGLWVAQLVKKLLLSVLRGASATTKTLSYFAQSAIVVLTFFMALDQLGVARSIIDTAFLLIMGGLALAFGLAFGLGGRELASSHLANWNKKVSEVDIDSDKFEEWKQEIKPKKPAEPPVQEPIDQGIWENEPWSDDAHTVDPLEESINGEALDQDSREKASEDEKDSDSSTPFYDASSWRNTANEEDLPSLSGDKNRSFRQ